MPDFTAGLRDGVSGLRVGVLRDYFFRSLDPDVQLAVDEAVRVLERQGAQIRDVTFPLASQIVVINSPIIQSEAATYHLPKLRNNWEQLSTKLRARLLPGLAVTADIYLNAQRARAVVVKQCLELMQDVDILLSPTEPVGAPRIDDDFVTIQGRTEGVVNTLTRLTRPFNPHRVPRHIGALRLHRGGPAGRPAAGVPSLGGSNPATRGLRLRAGHRLAHETARALMKHALIGAGGLGGIYGGVLARGGEDVTFIARGANLAALQAKGLAVRLMNGESFQVAVGATDDPRPSGRRGCDLVLRKDLRSG